MNINQTFDYDIDNQLAERLVALHKKHYAGDMEDDYDMNKSDDVNYSKFQQKVLGCVIEMMHDAAEAGYLDVLQNMHENGCPWDGDTTRTAAKNGHLNCLQYLHEHGCRWDEDTTSYASTGGHLECLQYAHEHGCPWNKKAFACAAYNGHLNCLQYLHENGCPRDEDIGNLAASKEHFKCVQFAIENGYHVDPVWVGEMREQKKYYNKKLMPQSYHPLGDEVRST